MLRTIEAECKYTFGLTGVRQISPAIMDAMAAVEREQFVPSAILAKLVQQVYSIEIIPTLAKQAQQRLQELDYTNVEVFHKDGYYGLEKYAPFDGILVTAAASHIPRPLTEQLKPGARMIIPVGLPYMTQQLMMVEKDASGSTFTSNVLAVAFVPLTGGIERDD